MVNLYPFAATIARPGCSYEEAIKNIDIGGPAMLRAAAKNHAAVLVVVDPADYGALLAELDAHGGGSEFATRARLAAKAFAHTAAYDTMVATYLAARHPDAARTPFPSTLALSYQKLQDLRYGENPHQRAAFYRDASTRGAGIASAQVLQGKELSFNNIADADTAIECVRQFPTAACVIVKHANPCGVATAASVRAAYEARLPHRSHLGLRRHHRLQPRTRRRHRRARSSNGSSSRCWRRRECPRRRRARSPRAPTCACSGWETSRPRASAALELRSVTGGLLLQTRDLADLEQSELKVPTRRKPTAAELTDLRFAWRVCKFVKSNAIVFARDGATLGIGAGQMSRVYSTRLAAMKASDEKLAVAGAVMASDAFFPFRDNLDVAAGYGIRAVIQPGGSLRDAEVIAAADEHDMAMVFTGMRHFRH